MKEAARDDGVYTITLCGGQEQKVSFWKDSPVGTLLVGYDFTHGEERKILVVARKDGKNVCILNAFEGKAADDIFKLLTTVKQKSEGKEE